MVIAINTRLLLAHRMEGIARYIYETTKRMVQDHPEDEFHFFFDRPYDEQFIFAANVTPHILSPPSRHPILWYLWFEKAVPKKLKEINAQVFYSGDMYCSLKTDCPTLMVSHDLNYEHHPEYLPWTARKYMSYFSPRYHRKADKLVAVSEATKKDIIQFYELPAKKISVAYNAAPDGFRPLSIGQQESIRNKWTSGQPYFVYVGSLHPRKNIPRLLQAYEAFKKQSGHPHKLVVYGRVAFKSKAIFDTLENMSFKEEVLFLDDGSLPVPDIMGAAAALCFPSLFEGFGIPILEAFACETPVITSNVSSMPEVAGRGGLLVDPLDSTAITQAMLLIVSDNNLSQALISAGLQQMKLFSWEQSSEHIYKELKNLALQSE